jgi:hypothetical protein
MKYILETKNEKTGAILDTKEFKSINEIALYLKCTYGCARKNFLYSINPDEKPAVKFSQILFDKKYTIKPEV